MPIIVATWSDVNTGHLVESSIHADEGAGGRAIMQQCQAKSNARNTSLRTTDEQLGWNNPRGGTARLSVGDRAMLVFSSSTGGQARLIIPAPDLSIFYSDGETVNPGAIGPLISAVLAHGTTPGGANLTAFLYGNLVKTNDRLQ